MSRALPAVLALALLFPAPGAPAQGCSGQGNASLSFLGPGIIGGPLTVRLAATPQVPFFWYVDTLPGNLFIPGIGNVCLGLSPNFFLLLDSFTSGLYIPPGGVLDIPVTLPGDPGLFGAIFYSQFGTADVLAPNNIGLSSPASVLFAAYDTYIQVANPMQWYRSLHTATPFGNGRYVLVAGGGSGTLLAPTSVLTTDIFDNYTRTFMAGPNMALRRSLHTATRLNDGRILVTGGIDPAAPNNWNDGEIYDPTTNTFTAVSNFMSSPRAGHTATLLANGNVLIAGGNTLFSTAGACPNLTVFQSAVATTDIYNPSTNSFAPGPSMPGARVAHEAVRLPNGSVLVAGGLSTGSCLLGNAVPTLPNQTYLYNPATNTFSTSTSLAAGRLKPILEILPSGNVFCGGGAINNILLLQILNSTNSVEIRNAASGNWSAGTALPQARVLAGVAREASGSLLILGGGQGNLANFSPIQNCTRYTEGANPPYTTLGFLPAALMSHTVSPLGDGTFVVAGGIDSSTISTNAGQIYTP